MLVPGASSSPCNDAYRGTHAFSEVEVKNVADYLYFMSRSGKIAGYMDIHAYSQLWMTPWGYTKQPPRDHTELVTNYIMEFWLPCLNKVIYYYYYYYYY